LRQCKMDGVRGVDINVTYNIDVMCVSNSRRAEKVKSQHASHSCTAG
jgi:hypothetical protein